jgi:ferredoxin, 2Fe-2S
VPDIFATDRDGRKYELAGRERTSLMEILRQAGLSIEALCSGSCQCATCHVFIEAPWLGMLKPQTDFEIAAFDSEGSEMRANSRLACQINWTDELDGIILTVAPEA